MLLGYAILFFILSVTLVYLFQRLALRKGWVDHPNARSSHHIPTPRGGGLVFVVLWLTGMSLITYCYGQQGLSAIEWRLFFPATVAVSLIGFLDDYRSLPARWRFLGQVLVACFCVVMLGRIETWQVDQGLVGKFSGGFEHSAFLDVELLKNSELFNRVSDLGIISFCWMAFAALSIVWSINLFNFMDGLDGFAASEAVMVLLFGGMLFWLAGVYAMAYLAWAMVCCVMGFLIWNWPKASVFMGDVGSYALGLLIALFAWVGHCLFDISLGLWFILYGIFWFDTTLTVMRRLVHGEVWYAAHKSHAYQRLQQAGYSVRSIVCGLLCLNTVLSGVAFGVYSGKWPLTLGISITVLLLSLVYGAIEIKKPMFIKTKK